MHELPWRHDEQQTKQTTNDWHNHLTDHKFIVLSICDDDDDGQRRRLYDEEKSEMLSFPFWWQ